MNGKRAILSRLLISSNLSIVGDPKVFAQNTRLRSGAWFLCKAVKIDFIQPLMSYLGLILFVNPLVLLVTFFLTPKENTTGVIGLKSTRNNSAVQAPKLP